jgi:NAD(P)-dependent dehydrogenase (short-subunit alcohol dehydrogenase family)
MTARSPFSLAGRTVVVTGGASGIGIGITEMLAEAGATVVIADIDAAGAERQASALAGSGHKAGHVRIDLSDEASIVAGCAEAVATHGTPWALVNNAGLQDREALFDATVAEWDRTIAVNARGPFLMIREIGRAMRDGGQGGRIVNVASCALIGQIVKGLAAYSASKGGLLALSRTCGFELVEHGITVNTVLPGGVLTPGGMNARGPAPEGPALRPPPLGMCEPRDIGAAVLFLASPEARFVTNQVVAVDAGWSLV